MVGSGTLGTGATASTDTATGLTARCVCCNGCSHAATNTANGSAINSRTGFHPCFAQKSISTTTVKYMDLSLFVEVLTIVSVTQFLRDYEALLTIRSCRVGGFVRLTSGLTLRTLHCEFRFEFCATTIT